MAGHFHTDDERRQWFTSLTWRERCCYDRAYSAAWAKNGQDDDRADDSGIAAVEKRRKEK